MTDRIAWVIGGSVAIALYCLGIRWAFKDRDRREKWQLVGLMFVCAVIGVVLALGSHSDTAAMRFWLGLLAVALLGLLVGMFQRAVLRSVVVAVAGGLTLPLWGLSLLGVLLGLSGSCFD